MPRIHTTILTIDIGTGLAVSGRIIGGLLQKLGHEVSVFDMRQKPAAPPPDCAIFLERFDARWAGRVNVFVPNHEWVRAEDLALLARFEIVACKTQEAMRVLSPHVAKERLVYIGWTTLDYQRTQIAKDFSQCLHLASCSEQKGTDIVLQAWRENTDLPHLTMIDWRSERPSDPKLPNLNYIQMRIAENELIERMNRSGVHLCPSITEGYGHTIHEALSCGSILLTTDGPPMNEQTRDCAILVEPSRTGTMGLATTYHVEPSQLAAAVRKVMTMGVDERGDLAQRARGRWEQNRVAFIRAVEKLARMIAERLKPKAGVIEAPAGLFFESNQFRA